ncbi:TIM-barrel domain-containing protein [Paenibacillus ginsengarvi]|uniref:TIM-barrel domain-containing protein n=1 Tax=Paenibacillus ginsengarvi TaxID=400777 RepID=UPI001315595C|nr:TIM-barrel domain-containing protein [Paenibacillus ginsengarvi]
MNRHMSGFPFRLGLGGWMCVSPVNPHTFRVRLNDTGVFPEQALIRYGIVRQPEELCPFSTEQNNAIIAIRTDQAELLIDRQNGQFRWNAGNGREIVRTATVPRSDRSGGFGICLAAMSGEALYGLGDVAPDGIERSGQKVEMWVAGTHFHSPIPFVMSSRGWAIMMNTTWKHSIHINSVGGRESEDNGHIDIEGPEGELDFYLFQGNDYAELLNRYTAIAGRPRLLPIWAYGLHYFCSVESGGRQIVEDALKFRQEGIPCDLIGLSDGWMAEEPDEAGNRQWDFRRFVISSSRQEPTAFIDTLHRHGFKLSLMLSCDYDLTAHEETNAGCEPQDAEAGAAKAWFDQLRTFVDEGVDAFKIPSANQTAPHPERSWANGMTDNEMHNLYPVVLGKQMQEGYVRQTGKRPMIHTVVGYTGMQQYTATECGKYGQRTTAVISALNSGLSGHAHTAIHMHVEEPEGIHASFLMPWAQNNSGRHFRHPCFLEEKQRALFRLYARLRYRLLPYLYSAAHTAANTGMPIARAMPLSFPDDEQCRNLFTQYMLGDHLLVGVFTENVYLPKGCWIDYWTGDRYEGPATIAYRVPEQAGGPLFVRAGAIIPMRPDMEYIEPSGAERLILHVYPDGPSESAIYEDDGITFRYEEGSIAETRIRCEADETRIVVRIWRRRGTYEGMTGRRSYEVVVHTENKPAFLRLNGQRYAEQTPATARRNPESGWKYDRLAGTIRLYAEEAAEADEPVLIELSLRFTEQDEQKQHGVKPDPSGAYSSPDAVAQETHHDSAEWLHIALDTCVQAEVEAALNVWWNSGKPNGSSDDNWRVRLLDGCLLLLRHAERRGWSLGDAFGADLANPLSHTDTQTAEQALALLTKLAGEVLAAAKKSIESVRHPILREIVAQVKKELHKKLSLQEFADRTGLHPVYLSRLFKREIGLPFSDYVLQQRMLRAKALLEAGMRVYEAASYSGFQDASHFSRVYSQYWGLAPVRVRRKET